MRVETHHGDVISDVRRRPRWTARRVGRGAMINWRRLLALAFNVAVWVLLLILARRLFGHHP
jgi:hypothetical protein